MCHDWQKKNIPTRGFMLLAMQYMNSNGIMENDAREDGESMSEVVSVSFVFL